MILGMDDFLKNIMVIHRSGLIQADSEELSITEKGVTVCWKLLSNPNFKLYYSTKADSSLFQLTLKDMGGGLVAQSEEMGQQTHPLPHVENLLTNLPP